MREVVFRPYSANDVDACLNIFDANCPEFFAVGERSDYEDFLRSAVGDYEICESDGDICGAFGVLDESAHEMRIRWILLHPKMHGVGIGSKIMSRIVLIARSKGVKKIWIAASQKSCPFFARFGATVTSITDNGWGIGLDRVDMELSVPTEEPLA